LERLHSERKQLIPLLEQWQRNWAQLDIRSPLK
jgi:hypothetical protein